MHTSRQMHTLHKHGLHEQSTKYIQCVVPCCNRLHEGRRWTQPVRVQQDGQHEGGGGGPQGVGGASHVGYHGLALNPSADPAAALLHCLHIQVTQDHLLIITQAGCQAVLMFTKPLRRTQHRCHTHWELDVVSFARLSTVQSRHQA